MGIMNADEIVAYYQALGNGEQIAAENGYNLKEITAEQITELVTLGNVAPITGKALAALALQERIAAGINFSEASDIAELEALAKAAGASALILEKVARAKQLAGLVKSGKATAADMSELTAINDLLKTHDFTQDVNIDFSKIGGGSGASGSAGSDAGDAYVEAYEKELKELQGLRDRGEISEKEYLDRLKALIDKFFKDRTEYAEKYAEEMRTYLEGMKSLYDSALSGVTTLLDKKIDAANKGKDAAIKALEEEQTAIEDRYQAEIDAIVPAHKACVYRRTWTDEI